MAQRGAADGYFDEAGYDAVVVGSGYGGSVAACRLAMAGIKVCLIEKGKRWEAKDFPTSNYQMWSKGRLESDTLGFSFGPKDALFQLYEQGNSVVGVVCGLGGGSLANMGQMVSTPVRTKKDPRWPKDWQKDWEAHETLALTMLNPQDPPVEFASAKALKAEAEEIEESNPTPIKQTINFNSINDPGNVKGTTQLDQCVAYGNCMSGCPYNAKNSNDKNYIALAIEAGCKVKTQCRVQYIVKDVDEDWVGGDVTRGQKPRTWRVFLDSLEYVCADFVVLSAGVLGTTQILFQSERRGLKISDRLGMAFSTNGNNFAYLAGSSLPLNGQGTSKEQFSNIPFQNRPGPSVSSSFTSSLGFTIESGVIPKAYPQLLLKGVFTHGWPNQYWFLHAIIDKLKQMMGVKSTQGMLLSLMGYDEGNGKITLDKATDKIRFSAPDDPLLPQKMKAIQRITKRLGGILFMSRYQSTSFHLLGGCNVASDFSHGVCNPNGQVFKTQGDPQAVHKGLYVCDASLIPCSIGINPSLSILAAAEHVSSQLVNDILKYKSINQPTDVPSGEVQLPLNQQDLQDLSKLHVGINGNPIMEKRSNEVLIKETLSGHLGGMPCTAFLIMKMDSKAYNKAGTTMGDPHPNLRGKVGGYLLSEFVQKDKLYIVDGTVDMCSVDSRTPYTQYMHYRLLLASPFGSRYIFEGSKVMNPFFLALNGWSETRTLHVTFKEVQPKDATKLQQGTSSTEEPLDLIGELHLSTFELLRSLVTMKGRQSGRFIYYLLQSFFRTYILQTPRMPYVDFSCYKLTEKPYPPHTLHSITTGDGFVISCKQWIPNGEKKGYPVLLLNGYSTESFSCPTEPRDLVTTLLDEGYEPWILQVRLHPVNPSNDFTIEDIGKFDIPAAFAKIRELHGPSIKVHVIAHCVGGIAIHISLLGGHISASDIISLSCTNSAMFFKVPPYSLVKMRLPILPILMAMLGPKKILPLHENIKAIPRHRLFKFILRLIPRYERCSCDKCAMFAGIFGNTFSHQNMTPTMCHFVHKQHLPSQVPLGGLPHLTKICVKGHIVNAKGEDIYLIHPERMALHTLYISSGRSILATPETSLLANQYMELHQPVFRHRRVVVEGFGHSDLFLGEESYKKVFPHMISHMKLSEQERNDENSGNMERLNNFKDPMS
ncbi:hypothetical protein AAC387_Pa05g1039 [Persea americana]